MSKQWTWTIGIHKDEWYITLYKVPMNVEVLATVWDWGCWVTRGWLGGHGRFFIPWLFRLENWILSRDEKYRIGSVPISEEKAREIDGAFWNIFQDESD